jgi:hypothetical protein
MNYVIIEYLTQRADEIMAFYFYFIADFKEMVTQIRAMAVCTFLDSTIFSRWGRS